MMTLQSLLDLVIFWSRYVRKFRQGFLFRCGFITTEAAMITRISYLGSAR